MLTEINSPQKSLQAPAQQTGHCGREEGDTRRLWTSHSKSRTIPSTDLTMSKWSLLRIQHRSSPIKGHRCCSKSVVPNRVATYSNAGGSARIEGVSYCNSGLCIVCGMKNLVDKSNRLAKVMAATNETHQYLLGTITINTNVSAIDQLEAMDSSWKVFHPRMKQWCKRRDSEYDVSWSMDTTIDIITGKIHLHRHMIIRLDKYAIDPTEFEKVYKDTWLSSVSKATGQIVVRAAQYCKPVQDIEAGSKYLFKSSVEAMGGANKASSYSGKRVGIFALLRRIAETNSPKLIGYYKELVGSFGEAGMRWSRIGTKVNEDYRRLEAEEAEEAMNSDKEVEEESAPTITIDKVMPQAHRLVMDSGVFPYLVHMLNSGYSDGNKEVEYFRSLVDDIGKCKELPHSVAHYSYWCEELRFWAEVCFPDLYMETKKRGFYYV